MADDGSPSGSKRRWGVEQRLEFVELRAFWDGSLNRGDIREQFGVSAPQASADIAAYTELAPGNLVYDGSLKRYLSAGDFTPRLTKPSAETYLRQLVEASVSTGQNGGVWLAAAPNIAMTPVPGRAVDSEVLRGLLATMRQRASVELLYQSMSPARPAPQWRRITPHSLATDGLRWHVRGYCHEDNRFKDFVLSRIRDARLVGDAGPLEADDIDWNTITQIGLVPNPDLSADQQAAVDWDFHMNGARVLNLEVRRALLYYLRQRLRLDVPYDRPAERPVVLADAGGFEEEIGRARGGVEAAAREGCVPVGPTA